MRIFSLCLLAALLVLTPSITFAQAPADEGLIRVEPLPGMAQGELIPAIKTIVNLFLTLVGIAAGIFLMIAGVRYITSGSDPDGQTKAKHQILYAVIGLIVIGLAAAIVNFTLVAITGGKKGGQQQQQGGGGQLPGAGGGAGGQPIAVPGPPPGQ